MSGSLQYQTGFGNYFQTEAMKGALPNGRNSPQKVPFGLYAEQLSGTAFAVPRHANLHSWLYRILPSVLHSNFEPLENKYFGCVDPEQRALPPTQMRWSPLPDPTQPTDFIDGLVTMAHNGSLTMLNGAAIHLYAINKSMTDRFFYNADGDFLIVLQAGKLKFNTEFGLIEAEPGEIVVIQRGIKFQVELLEEKARGYICENYGLPLRLPDLGVIGANGLANPRDFQIPVAHFSEQKKSFKLVTKFQHRLWQAEIDHSPLNVVAWHGNYAPYKYNLRNFNTLNSVSFDHPDPSIFTVLTSPTAIPGISNLDFVIFPDRWMVAEDTFRPPYYHRNIMNEFMGLIYGSYDAKETGFVPGGCSLHNCMSAHGPDANAHQKAVQAKLKPEYYSGTLAFMFESCYVWQPTPYALQASFRQQDYLDCWQGLKVNFVAPS